MDYIIPIVVAAAVIAGLAYWFIVLRKKDEQNPEVTPLPVTPSITSDWTIGPIANGANRSVGMPVWPTSNPDGSWFFDFAPAPASVHGVTRAVSINSPRGKVVATFAVEGGGEVISTQDGGLAYATITFQEAGDNWSAQGPFASYRWFAGAHSVKIAEGDYVVEIPLTQDHWGNALGISGVQDPYGFAQAVADMDNIGIAFGNPGAGATEHGATLKSGSARFICKSFELE